MTCFYRTAKATLEVRRSVSVGVDFTFKSVIPWAASFANSISVMTSSVSKFTSFRGTRVAVFLIPLVFLATGILTLFISHPAEDAYILFRYAKHIAAQLGIVFNAMGPPTEGATDFLWVILIGGLVFLGVDVAFAALIINTLGFSLIVYLYYRAIQNQKFSAETQRFLTLCLISLPFLGGFIASVFGFNSMFFGGLALLLFVITYEHGAKANMLVPYLALALGLIRPDGVIIGLGACVATAIFAQRKGSLKQFLLHLSIAGFIGIIYFVWRYFYFGNLLPLPLYVKQNGPFLHGLLRNAQWLLYPDAFGFLFIFSCFVFAKLRKIASLNWNYVLLGLMPVWFLLLSLTFAYQSQNIGWRFQAPVYLIFGYLLFIAVGKILEQGQRDEVADKVEDKQLSAVRVNKGGWKIGFVSVLFFSVLSNLGVFYVMTVPFRSYVDQFPLMIKSIVPTGSKIILTEAGRIPFWLDAEIIDAVGLNTEKFAKMPISNEDIESINPEIIMFHNAKAFKYDFSDYPLANDLDISVMQINPQRLIDHLSPKYNVLSVHDFAQYNKDIPNTVQASYLLAKFVANRQDYITYAVRYGAQFKHYYSIKKSVPYLEEFVSLLQKSHDKESYRSYMKLKREI